MLRFVSKRIGTCLCLSLCLLFFSYELYAQGVAINAAGTAPDASAMLDVNSTTQGFLMPRMTSGQRLAISSPAEGLMVFDTQQGTPWTYHQGRWSELVPIPSGSILWRTDRQDILMQQSGFSYLTEQLIPNSNTVRVWQVPGPTSTGAPSAREDAYGCWVGTEMVIWGGGIINDGGRYIPSSDTWQSISTTNAPPSLFNTTVGSSDNELFVWGGGNGFSPPTNTGYAYNLASDQWSLMSTTNAPTGRNNASAVWLGNEWLVWGGDDNNFLTFPPQLFNDGGTYNPSTDTWTAISTVNAPSARNRASIVYTGSKVFVWGGQDLSSNNFYDGGLYDPATDTWTTVSNVGAPTGLAFYKVFASSGKIVVFGQNATTWQGAIYDPASDTWTAMNLANIPTDRVDYSLVNTGTEIILWGGRFGGTFFSDGGVFDVQANAWSSFSLANAPTARSRHTAVWTGTEMIIFGGRATTGVLQAPAILSSPGNYIYYLYRKN